VGGGGSIQESDLISLHFFFRRESRLNCNTFLGLPFQNFFLLISLICPVLKKIFKCISLYLHNILTALSAVDFCARLDVLKVVLH
jgi:hypothetical protein